MSKKQFPISYADRKAIWFYPIYRKLLLIGINDKPPKNIFKYIFWAIDRGFLAPFMPGFFGGTNYQCHITDTLILGGNPLLTTLTALSICESGHSVCIAPQNTDKKLQNEDDWGYSLLAHEGFKTFLQSALKQENTPNIDMLNLENVTLDKKNEADISHIRPWLETSFDQIAKRLESAQEKATITYLNSQNDYRLHQHIINGETAIEVKSSKDSSTPPKDKYKNLIHQITHQKILKPHKKILFKNKKNSKNFVIAKHIILTAPLKDFCKTKQSQTDKGNIELKYDNPLITAIGQARYIPANAEEALKSALEDCLTAIRCGKNIFPQK